jgi:hypothetical protein
VEGSVRGQPTLSTFSVGGNWSTRRKPTTFALYSIALTENQAHNLRGETVKGACSDYDHCTWREDLVVQEDYYCCLNNLSIVICHPTNDELSDYTIFL